MGNVLDDIKVLDLTRVLAGPWCTQSLVDLGATVYKVERPEVGDEWRHLPPFLSDGDDGAPRMSTAFSSINRGKQSITVNISNPEGQSIIRRLAKQCDVLIENYRAGDLARYGLDYVAIRELKPDIIYCSITGYGPDGPAASYPGYDPVFQAITGIMSTCGTPDGMPGQGPQRTMMPFIDVMTGLTATSAVLAAIMKKYKGGGGSYVDIALLDVAFAAMTPYAQAYLCAGKVPMRQGNTSSLYAPSNSYRCAQGRYILIQVGNDMHWERMCRALDLEAWLADGRYKTNAARLLHAADLDVAMNAVCGAWDVHDLARLLGDAGVPCGPINTVAEGFGHPQVSHREITRETRHSIYGAVPYVRNPLSWSFPNTEDGSFPLLGEHTASILARELGIEQPELETLRRKGVV